MDTLEAVERALSLSRADACVVAGRRRSTVHLRWAANTVTTSGVVHDQLLTVVSISGNRVASATRKIASPAQVEEVVRRSEEASAQVAESPDCTPLVDGGAEPRDWRAPAAATDVHALDALAPPLGRAFERARRSGLLTFGYAAHRATTVWLATSRGVRRRNEERFGTITVTGKTSDLRDSAWLGTGTEGFADVDAAALFETLRERLGWSERRVVLPPGQYEVLLEPSCTADLAVAAYGMMSRRRADEGRSPYSRPGGGTRIGERLFGRVTMYSDPDEPGIRGTPFCLEAAPHEAASVFDSGLAVGRTEWVRDGELRALVTPRSWAARTGLGAPVPYVNNLVVAGGGPTLGEMIAGTDRALLVTCLWYMQTVDPRLALLSGLTRDGVFLVERGRITAAVNDFRWDMSPIAVFAQATEIGGSRATLPRDHASFVRVKAPPIRVERFTMSSAAGAA